ncbi:MAG: septal ring lytic transglycosylase RlpA family protein [Bacteroidota bacterium]
MRYSFLIVLGICGLSMLPGNFTQRGTASYYADKLNGRRTASGELFHNTNMTAAHKTLKLGTWVKVTNLSNDSTVVLKVNDRMGQSSPHCIDITTAAAKKLNFLGKGIAKVLVEEIEQVNQVTDQESTTPSEK